MSLWSVADESTSLLFQFFYQHLRSGMPPAPALAAARNDLRTHNPGNLLAPPYADPFFWAPFIYIGTP